jgi:hypothetical protein
VYSTSPLQFLLESYCEAIPFFSYPLGASNCCRAERPAAFEATRKQTLYYQYDCAWAMVMTHEYDISAKLPFCGATAIRLLRENWC